MNLEAESSAQLMRVQSGTVLTQREQIDTFSRLRDGLRSVVHSYGRRIEYPESAGSSQASSSFPCSTTEPAPPIPPYNTGNCSTLHNGYTHDNRCSGIHHVQWFCHRLRTHSALCCSGHLGAAAGILLLCPWSAAVCSYGTSTTDDVCGYGTAPTDGILHTCRGGAFSRRHTWYEFCHCTESIQH